MSPSRTHPTGLDRIIGISYPKDTLSSYYFRWQRQVFWLASSNSWQAVFPKKCQWPWCLPQ